MPSKFHIVPKKYKCPKCKGTYSRKSHECYPARNREVPPENRPELHHRDDLKAALSPKGEIKHEPSAISPGTVGVLLPEIEPERKERPVKIRKGVSKQKDRKPTLDHPETETRYESPKAIRDMDQTNDYAHAYREEGKYGSHPSHNGFDDESTP
jgi:hypothetical protein